MPSNIPRPGRAAAWSLVAGLVAGPALADDPPGVPVAPLVVTATRTPTPLGQVGSTVTLITAAEIQARQWRTLPDALAFTPGLNVVQNGGPGGLTAVFIRGANSNHTKVIIDGIEANDPSQNGSFDFGQVLTAGVARVEVLRGPQSSLYGADALGGVIAITTTRGEGPTRIDASLEGGSFRTFDQSVSARGSGRVGDWAVNLSHFRAAATPVTPLDLLPPGQSRSDDDYENTTVSTKLDADLAKGAAIGLVARFTASRLQFTGEDLSVFPSVPATARSDQTNHQLFLRGEARLSPFGDGFSNVVGVGYTLYRTRLQSPDVPFGPQPPTFDRGDRLKFDWQGALRLAPDQTLVLGLEDETERLIDSPVNASDETRAGFVELQSKLAPGLFADASVRHDDDGRFGGQTTWRITPTWTVRHLQTQLKASFGTGFKAPTLTQLFVSYPEFRFFANPNLRPETSTGYDIGFEQPLARGAVTVGATWFHNAITDLIEVDAAGDSFTNIGKANTHGVESFVAATLGRRLTLRADYTWTVARDALTGEALLRRPLHKASLAADWRPAPRVALSATALYVGSWVDGNRSFSIPRLNAPPYATVNLAGSYDLGRGLTLFGRVDNLLDKRYEDPVGFQKAGIGVFGGVRVTLGGTASGA
ncbi:MAG: TonB-dependent receptor [Caulobacteraceae bacterium]